MQACFIGQASHKCVLATYVRMAYHMQVNQLCRQHKHVFYCFCQWYHSISFHSISFPVYFISPKQREPLVWRAHASSPPSLTRAAFPCHDNRQPAAASRQRTHMHARRASLQARVEPQREQQSAN